MDDGQKILQLGSFDDDAKFCKDYDRVLRAAEPVKPKHVKIVLPQAGLLGHDNDGYGLDDLVDVEPEINLTSGCLKSFVSANKLKSFEFVGDDACLEPISPMIQQGHFLLHFATERLTKLVLSRIPLRTDYLRSVLVPTLKHLELSYLSLDSLDQSPWSPHARTTLRDLIANNCRELIKLELEGCCFEDSDLQVLLENRPGLRSLTLAGYFGEGDFGGGCLTDVGLGQIARLCPNLRELSVDYNRDASSAGVRSILQGCRQLLVLRVEDLQIAPEDVVSLVSLSDTLLLFSSTVGHFRGISDSIVKQAVEATGGRTLIMHGFQGILEVSGVSETCKQESQRSKDLIEQADENAHKPDVFDEWEGVI